MTENPNLPAPSSPGSKLRPVILYGVLPGVLMLGFGWYYGRPPALLLVCWAFLGVGLGAFLYWKARPQWIALIGLLTVMMCKPFMHHYFLGIPSWKVPLSIELAGLGALLLGMVFCICILQTVRPKRVQP